MALTALLSALARRVSNFTCARGSNEVAVVGGDVILRLWKSNNNGRSHVFMNDNERKNCDDMFIDGMEARPSSFLVVLGGHGSVSLELR